MSVGLWIALALGIVNLAVWAVVVVLARRLKRQLAPLLATLLPFMLAEPVDSTTASDAVERISLWAEPDDAA